MYVVLNGTLNVSRAAVFASTGRSESHQEEILLNKIEEGGYIGEEILFPAYANKYLYTVRVESLNCKLLVFNKSQSATDYCVRMLAEYMQPILESKIMSRGLQGYELEKRFSSKLQRVPASLESSEPEFMKAYFRCTKTPGVKKTHLAAYQEDSTRDRKSGLKKVLSVGKPTLPQVDRRNTDQQRSRDPPPAGDDFSINSRMFQSQQTEQTDIDHSIEVLKISLARKLFKQPPFPKVAQIRKPVSSKCRFVLSPKQKVWPKPVEQSVPESALQHSASQAQDIPNSPTVDYRVPRLLELKLESCFSINHTLSPKKGTASPTSLSQLPEVKAVCGKHQLSSERKKGSSDSSQISPKPAKKKCHFDHLQLQTSSKVSKLFSSANNTPKFSIKPISLQRLNSKISEFIKEYTAVDEEQSALVSCHKVYASIQSKLQQFPKR